MHSICRGAGWASHRTTDASLVSRPTQHHTTYNHPVHRRAGGPPHGTRKTSQPVLNTSEADVSGTLALPCHVFPRRADVARITVAATPNHFS